MLSRSFWLSQPPTTKQNPPFHTVVLSSTKTAISDISMALFHFHFPFLFLTSSTTFTLLKQSFPKPPHCSYSPFHSKTHCMGITNQFPFSLCLACYYMLHVHICVCVNVCLFVCVYFLITGTWLRLIIFFFHYSVPVIVWFIKALHAYFLFILFYFIYSDAHQNTF